jgi:hypothetical protein
MRGGRQVNVYYRGPDVLITEDLFVLQGASAYRIRELREVAFTVTRKGLRQRTYELWAMYRGRRVLLHRSADAQLSGQVRRALVRAFEAADMDTGGAAYGSMPPWPRDPWPQPTADKSVPSPRVAVAEPRWRTTLERLLGLPLTATGAMTVAVHRFDDRMTALLTALGDPDDGRSA